MPSSPEPAAPRPTCPTCGDALRPGPLGPRCSRCLLALAAAQGEEDEQSLVVDLFPELNIQGCVARGGFGAVYRAEHRRMRRPVALKFLDSLLAKAPEAVALFEQEMISVGGLDHPGIVRAHDAGEREGHWFIVMEFIDGPDCGTLCRRHGKFPVAEACEIIRQAAVALHHAHQQGLVHRDVKPGNLMLAPKPGSDERVVKVLDFGLAGFAVAPAIASLADPRTERMLIGTLEYCAPEQIETPAKVDARADVFGLGATLRRLLTGQPPRLVSGGGETSLFLRMKDIAAQSPPPILTARPDLPAELARLCDRLLALRREDRPATAAEVASLLAPWCEGAELASVAGEGPLALKPIRRRFRWRRPLKRLALGLAATTALLLALSWRLFLPGPPPRAAPVTEVVPPPPPPPPLPPGERSVFSAGIVHQRFLDEYNTPRLVDPEWEHDWDCIESDEVGAARLLPNGDVLHLSHTTTHRPGLFLRKSSDPHARPLVDGRTSFADALSFVVDPVSGIRMWTRQHDRRGETFARARADGTMLPPLCYDFSSEISPLIYEPGRQLLLAAGGPVADGHPWGLAMVAEGQVPENTGLRAGDAVVADEGHRELVKGVETFPGLWAVRPDQDKPARRLGSLPRPFHFPCDAAVHRHGVFLLNRSETIPSAPVKEWDKTQRLLCWDLQGFQACTLLQPLYDPTALVADPSSGDLYAAQGGLINSSSPAIQRVLRLRPVGKDVYDVQVVAERFGRLLMCGLGMSADGKRLVITDKGNGVVVVLKRKG